MTVKSETNELSSDEINLNVYTRADFRANSELLNKMAKIAHKQELEFNYPYSIPEIEHYKARYSLDPFPYDTISYIVYESDNEFKAYGLISNNSKLSKKMAFCFIYVTPSYRGNQISNMIAREALGLV